MSLESLHSQYNSLLERLFDIMPITYLSVDDMGDANGVQVDAYGGLQDVDSYTILNGIVTTASGISGDDVLRKTFAHYLYYTSRQKPFVAHNSRTGTLSALYFLENNGRTWNGQQYILENIAQKAEADENYSFEEAYGDIIACGRNTIS